MASSSTSRTGIISPRQSAWPSIQDVMPVKNGIDNDAILTIHSASNLLKTWKKKDGIVQVISHRGISFNGGGIAENSKTALFEALKCLNLIEIDVLPTKDNVWIAAHDRGSHRVLAEYADAWANLNSGEVLGKKLIIRDVRDAKFTSNYIVTPDKVERALSLFKAVLKKKPKATIFMDARNGDGGAAIAFISNFPEFFNHVVVKINAHGYDSGGMLVQDVEKNKPTSGWKKNVAIMACLPVERIEKMPSGGSSSSSTPYEKALEKGKRWVDSFVRQNMRLVSIELPVSTVGKWFSRSTGKAKDPATGREVTDDQVTKSFMLDRVLIELCSYMNAKYPKIAIGGVCRTYDYQYEGVRYTGSVAILLTGYRRG